jgi:hypothetical protein
VKARSSGQDRGSSMNCGVLATLNIAFTTSVPGTMIVAEVRITNDSSDSRGNRSARVREKANQMPSRAPMFVEKVCAKPPAE